MVAVATLTSNSLSSILFHQLPDDPYHLANNFSWYLHFANVLSVFGFIGALRVRFRLPSLPPLLCRQEKMYVLTCMAATRPKRSPLLKLPDHRHNPLRHSTLLSSHSPARPRHLALCAISHPCRIHLIELTILLLKNATRPRLNSKYLFVVETRRYLVGSRML